MTTWTVGTTESDAYAVYRDGELYFIAASENGEAQPAKERAEWLVGILNAADALNEERAKLTTAERERDAALARVREVEEMITGADVAATVRVMHTRMTIAEAEVKRNTLTEPTSATTLMAVDALLNVKMQLDDALARAERAEKALRKLVHSHDGFHTVDCGAETANDEDVCRKDHSEHPLECAEPHCDCGATASRNEARAALKGGE